MARTTSDRLETALDYIKVSPGIPEARSITQDGKASVTVGQGGTQARVYRPTSEEQAIRNLNFALANLEAYVRWDRQGRAEQARIEQAREENLRKAEAEAKRRETRLKNGLDLYNKVHSTRHMTWDRSGLSVGFRGEWAEKAEEILKLQRASNPFTALFTGTIDAGITNYFRP